MRKSSRERRHLRVHLQRAQGSTGWIVADLTAKSSKYRIMEVLPTIGDPRISVYIAAAERFYSSLLPVS